MLINRTNFILKDGRTAVIRSANEDDAEGLLRLLKQTAEDTTFLSMTYGEVLSISIEEERQFIEQKNTSPHNIFMICEVEDEIVATFGIVFSKHTRQRHFSSVGIQVSSKFWNQGIGTKFFELGFEIIKQMGKTLVELSVRSDNKRAINLYTKVGFRKIATVKNKLYLEDNTYKDVDIMIKEIKEQ